MFCPYEAPPDSNVVAIFVDLENILDCRQENREKLVNDITNFLAALRIQLHRAQLTVHQQYRCLYLEDQWWHKPEWREHFVESIARQGFFIKWTLKNQAAEHFIYGDIRNIIQSGVVPGLPRLVVIFSGDGDLIPIIDELRWRRHDVCVVSKRESLNRWLKCVASGTIYLTDLTLLPTT